MFAEKNTAVVVVYCAVEAENKNQGHWSNNVNGGCNIVLRKRVRNRSGVHVCSQYNLPYNTTLALLHTTTIHPAGRRFLQLTCRNGIQTIQIRYSADPKTAP